MASLLLFCLVGPGYVHFFDTFQLRAMLRSIQVTKCGRLVHTCYIYIYRYVGKIVVYIIYIYICIYIMYLIYIYMILYNIYISLYILFYLKP